MESVKSKKKQQGHDKSERSQLSKTSVIKWLRSRFRNEKRRNNSYLYLPQELVRETSLQKIFKEFDADGSGGLSRDEVFDMFNGFGISISMDHLNQLYDSVQVNLEELDCSMFKRCVFSEQSNRVFREIVEELSGQYLPHNFISMIIYLVYLSKREEVQRRVREECGVEEKVEGVESLLRMKDLMVNNQRLRNHSDNYKQGLRNKFRDIWETVNQKYHQRYPYTPKLAEEFFRFYRA